MDRKLFKELDLSNAYLFAAALSGEETCRLVLEMQGQNKGNLAMWSRYHQAQMDVLSLEPGEDFSVLKPSYVIFICAFDPF